MSTDVAKAKSRHQLELGLDLPLAGAPYGAIVDGPSVRKVALIGDDYVGMKPTMAVKAGDQVRKGQLLFDDKKNAGVRYVSPATGTVSAVNRGAKRKFESLEIEVGTDDGGDEGVEFTAFRDHFLYNLEPEKVRENLIQSGLWTAFRTRPYSKVPAVDAVPSAIFVTAIDTNPLAADPASVLKQSEHDRWFVAGLQALNPLTDGPIYLCTAEGAEIPGTDEKFIHHAEFSGPHPAGLPGTHIHFLLPVNEKRTVWHVNYQDVIAIGHLFVTGKLLTDRVVSIAGPALQNPRLVKTRLGASIEDLTADNQLKAEGETRVISGSVFAGRAVSDPLGYLGRYHQQVSVLAEGRERHLLGWALPGFKRFSVTKAFAAGFSKLTAPLDMTTSTQGSIRAVVPIGTYERVMPLDILPTPLLKALLVQDTDTALELGCLELDEEDLALCTFACPGKNDYGSLLRECLTHIEREG